MIRILCLLAGLFSLAAQIRPPAPAVKPAPRAAKTAPPHPDVGDGDCAACHRDLHGPLVADYEASRHGRGLVGCVVCHGAVSAGFVARPGPDRCFPCHAAKVDSLKLPLMKGKTCRSCHAAHRLNPHAVLHKNQPGAAR